MQNEESTQLRQAFLTEIRYRQKELIFKKIRSQTLQQERLQNQSLNNIHERISKIDHRCDNIEGIYDLLNELKDLLGEARSIAYWGGDDEGFMKILYLIKKIVKVVEGHIRIDIEDDGDELIDNVTQDHPFGDLMVSVEYFLSDFMAEEVIYSECILEEILAIIDSPYFLMVYQNLFLTENIEIHLKCRMVRQYIDILLHHPTVFLENCVKYIEYLYYSIETEPKLSGVTECPEHSQIIELIEKGCGILTHNVKIEKMEKCKFYMFAFILLKELCCNNQRNCWYVMNSKYLMAKLEEMVKELSSSFEFDQITFEQYPNYYLISGLKMFLSLTYSEEVSSSLHIERPELIIILLKIIPKLGLGNWEKKGKQIPCIFSFSGYFDIVSQILKIVSNLICNLEICETFIQICESCNEGKWVGVLTDVYYTYSEKRNDLRLQCLMVYWNVFLVFVNKGGTYGSSWESRDENDIEGEIEYLDDDASQWRESIFKSLEHTDLILETLKLSCAHSPILNCLLIAMKLLLELYPPFKNTLAFSDTEVVNRITNIALVDDLINFKEFEGDALTKSEKYPNDVILRAQILIEAIRIG